MNTDGRFGEGRPDGLPVKTSQGHLITNQLITSSYLVTGEYARKSAAVITCTPDR